MHSPGQVFGSFQFPSHESFVDYDVGSDIGEFTASPSFDLLFIGSKFRCIRSTPTETQSIRENDFECLASTGVNTPETMFPRLR